MKDVDCNLQQKMEFLKWKMASINLINSCLMININRLYIDVKLIELGVSKI
jgi:hypothetical protein